MNNSAENFRDPFSDLIIRSINLYAGAVLATAFMSKNQMQMGLEIMNLFMKPAGQSRSKKTSSRKFNELQEAIGCKEF